MKQAIKKGLVIIGLMLSMLVVPVISNITRDCKSTVSNISVEPEQKYKASVSDVIEQEIYLEESLESLSLYMSLENTGKIKEPISVMKKDGVIEVENLAEFKVEVLGLSIEEEKVMEFEYSNPNTTIPIPVGKHDDKGKWVTVRITVEDVKEGMDLYFFFDSVTDSVKDATMNGRKEPLGLSLKYTQKKVISTKDNLLSLAAIVFLVVFLIWYLGCWVSKKENKLNAGLFCAALFMEVLWFYFYDKYIYAHDYPYIKKFFFLLMVLLFAVILGLFFLLKKKAKLEWIATYCVFGFGLIYLLILPAFSAPDEQRHYISAYKLSNQMLLQEPVDINGNVFVRVGDYEIFNKKPGVEYYGNFYGSIFDFSNNDATLVGQNEAVDAGGGIVAHLPGAIGITIARLLKLNRSMMLLLGRFMGLLFYCFCIYWAIKKMPFGKMVLFVISMFPMTLEEASSFSYDLVVNGLVFFVTAYMLSLIYEKPKVSIKDVILVSLTLFLVAPCKAVYIFVAGMWILIPKEKFVQSKMKKGQWKWLTTLIVFLSTLLPNMIVNMSKVSGISTNSGLVSWAGERGYSMSDLLQNIPYSFCIFINTLVQNLEGYLNTIVGRFLGWLEIPVSQFVVVGFLMILFLEFFRVKEQYVIKTKERVCYGILAGLISLAVLAAMWLAWTPVSYDNIQGVQGRYFLPMIPLLYLVVANNKKIKIKSSMNLNIIFLCLLNVCAIFDVLKITFCR